MNSLDLIFLDIESFFLAKLEPSLSMAERPDSINLANIPEVSKAVAQPSA
jgi:hypothetical protein